MFDSNAFDSASAFDTNAFDFGGGGGGGGPALAAATLVGHARPGLRARHRLLSIAALTLVLHGVLQHAVGS